MKKAIMVLASLGLAVSAFAQGGTVTLTNRKTTAAIDAPVFYGADKVSGTDFLAQLYAGADANSLLPIGNALPFSTGAAAGYINTAADSGGGGVRTITTVAAGADAFMKVVAWKASQGATYAAALALGQGGIGSSDVLKITTGGGGTPPATPAFLVGLKTFTVSTVAVVPEPSILALAGLGGLGLLLRRRK